MQKPSERGHKFFVAVEPESFLFPKGEIPATRSEVTSRAGYFALVPADRLIVVKFVAKSVAAQCGFKAVFMPKPIARFAASGTHVHFSMFKEGKNTFYDQEDKMETVSARPFLYRWID